jgi:antirestriction protein ArdC/phage/plasmid primase-like uncharacterized protein
MAEVQQKGPTWRETVIEELVRHIEEGTAPWQKPWDPNLIRDRAHNPASGTAYKGINSIWLDLQPYADPRWMTYRQASAQDAQVRKGEKGTKIEFWKWEERRQQLNEAGRPLTDSEGNALYETVRLERPKVFYATVFNAEQIDGLEPYKAPERTFEPVEEAEKVLAGGGVRIHHDQTDRAFYAINKDAIHLPRQEAFGTAYEYYATALHELGHATGHESRLNREFGAFGSETYAREELRAEIASYLITTELGLGHFPERHAAYVRSWANTIKEDPAALFRAVRDAENIRSWVLEPDKRLSLELSHKKRAEQALAADESPRKQQEAQLDTPDGAEQEPPKRIYLAVPYEEKDAAKELGARWDRGRKSWYVRAGTDLETVAKWLPEANTPKREAPSVSPQEEFAEALEANGLKLKGAPQMDGKWHRVPVEGDRKGQLSGSYRGFLDGRPAGQIMNYKTGEKAVQWVATGSRLDPEELARVKADSQARRASLEAEIAETQAKTAKRAYAVYINAAEAPQNHPYLENKQVKAHGLKVDENGNLLVPMRDEKGFLWNLQVIREDGTKRFLKGGRKTGLMHVIGDGNGPLLIAEGYATAASLEKATGRQVAVAFDAGNLGPVAEALKAKEPERALVIAADDDHGKERNAGLARAREAAEAVKAELIVPPLTEAEKAKGLTDFNDIARERGPEALKAHLALLVQDKAPEKQKASARGKTRSSEAIELGV